MNFSSEKLIIESIPLIIILFFSFLTIKLSFNLIELKSFLLLFSLIIILRIIFFLALSIVKIKVSTS